MSQQYIQESLRLLRQYCQDRNFRGWDPYDGLNSSLLKGSPLKKIKLFRLLWIQAFKRSPLNLRKVFLVEPGYNPKGLGLFLSGYANLYKQGRNRDDKNTVEYLANKLIELQCPGYSGACWGYNFDWQSRAFFLPAFTPNVVTSTFCGQAFCDAYDVTNEKEYLRIAISVSEFIRKDLNCSVEGEAFCFSYSPLDRSRVFNASLLASRFLARIYSYTQDFNLIADAKKSVEYCCNYQASDGSWVYGANKNQGWIDSFHTGYNLEAIFDYTRYSKDNSYQRNFEQGLDYYLSHFFTIEGIPKYYQDNAYPIDVHACAQLVVLMLRSGLLRQHKELVDRVLNWTIMNMQDRQGYFYFQKYPRYTIKIPYIRWACAWMFYALSLYLGKET